MRSLSKMKSGDKLLFFFILFIVTASLFFIHHTAYQGDHGQDVVILQDGKEVLRSPLREDGAYWIIDGTVRKAQLNDAVPGRNGSAAVSSGSVSGNANLIVISGNRAWCAYSNCSNQTCVQTGAIGPDSRDFPIVCLPHKVMITVE